MIPPSVVRGRRSVRRRTTEFQAAGSSTVSPEYPRVRNPMAPIENGPACPVSRPPPAMSPRSPTRRLKKTSVCRGVPNWNSPAPLQEELPLFGIEQVEAGEVDLDVIGLHLREVGVPGEVEGEVRGQ